MSKSQVPNSLLGKSHTRTDSLNHFFKPGPHSHRAFENPTANLPYPGMYHFEACKINCFALLGDSSYFVPAHTESDFCFLHINTQIFFFFLFLRSCHARLELTTRLGCCFACYSGEAPHAAGGCRSAARRCRAELGRGCSFPSVGLARRHKPLLSSTDLLGRFVSKSGHV